MTPQEFKAWFEGFTEAFDRIPTKAQWARVKERVAEIDGKPVTERVFVDRYWANQYPPLYYTRPPRPPYWAAYGNAVSQNGASASAAHSQSLSAQSAAGDAYRKATAFNSGQAMLQIGRADAQALAV